MLTTSEERVKTSSHMSHVATEANIRRHGKPSKKRNPGISPVKKISGMLNASHAKLKYKKAHPLKSAKHQARNCQTSMGLETTKRRTAVGAATTLLTAIRQRHAKTIPKASLSAITQAKDKYIGTMLTVILQNANSQELIS